MTGKILKGRSDFPSVFWNPATTVQKPQKIRILLAQNSQTSEELRSQTHRACESYDAHEPCVRGCPQGELGRCPAVNPAFALLSKDTQEANQEHLVFTDSMSTTQTGFLPSPPSGAWQQLPPGTSTSRKSSIGENKSHFVRNLPFPGW